MARSTNNNRGQVFGTQSMTGSNPVMVNNAGSVSSQQSVASQFGASLSKTPIYVGRQKAMRRR